MKTRIQCRDNAFHVVEFDDEWNLVSATCKDAGSRAARMAGVMSLGGRSRAVKKGCAALIGLIRYGIPQSVRSVAIGEEIYFKGWEEIYIQYEENKLTKARMEDLFDEDAQRFPEVEAAEKAFFSCRYRPDQDDQDREDLTTFVPHASCDVGTVVGYDQYDPWVIPLQEGWLENVGERGLATVNGRFVCGVKEKGKLLVVDRLREGEFGICERKAG